MNPILRPILVFLSGSALLLYLGTFGWFAWSALFGKAGLNGLAHVGPLNGQANEAVAYVWTTVSLLVGGVVAVAFGQPAPKPLAVGIPTERIVVAYAWAFMAVGILAVIVWIAAGENGGASLLIKNAAVAFFGLAVPILTSFLRLPTTPDESSVKSLSAMTGTKRFAICADFSLFPDDTPLPSSFEFAGFKFEEAGAAVGWFVNESGMERGLQFLSTGGRVCLPKTVPEVTIRLGAFAGTIELQALNTAGNIVGTSSVPGTNTWMDVRMHASEIAAISFLEGGGEGAIQKICIVVDAD